MTSDGWEQAGGNNPAQVEAGRRDAVRTALTDLLRNQRDLADDHERLEGYLRDYCPHQPAEVAVVVVAARSGVPNDLSRTSEGIPVDAVVARLANRMHAESGVDQTLARWAVETWAIGLGRMSSSPAAPAAPAAAPPPAAVQAPPAGVPAQPGQGAQPAQPVRPAAAKPGQAAQPGANGKGGAAAAAPKASPSRLRAMVARVAPQDPPPAEPPAPPRAADPAPTPRPVPVSPAAPPPSPTRARKSAPDPAPPPAPPPPKAKHTLKPPSPKQPKTKEPSPNRRTWLIVAGVVAAIAAIAAVLVTVTGGGDETPTATEDSVVETTAPETTVETSPPRRFPPAGGAVPPGRYLTSVFDPAFSLAVTQPWAVGAFDEKAGFLTLQRADVTDSSLAALDFIRLTRVFKPDAIVASREDTDRADLSIPAPADVGWITANSRLTTSRPVPFSVPGATAVQVEVTVVRPYESFYCDRAPLCLPMWQFPPETGVRVGRLQPGIQYKLYVINVGDQKVLAVYSATSDQYARLLPDVDAMVKSLTFGG